MKRRIERVIAELEGDARIQAMRRANIAKQLAAEAKKFYQAAMAEAEKARAA